MGLHKTSEVKVNTQALALHSYDALAKYLGVRRGRVPLAARGSLPCSRTRRLDIATFSVCLKTKHTQSTNHMAEQNTFV